MSINSVSAGAAHLAHVPARAAQEKASASANVQDAAKDGNKDRQAAPVPAANPGPTVNASGQTVGSLINTIA